MASDPRPQCKYYATCYRRNPTHLAQFRHPSDDAAGATDDVPSSPAKKPSLLKAAAHAIATVAKKAAPKPTAAAPPATAAAAAAARPAEDAEMKQAEAKHGTKRARDDAASPRPPASPTAAAAAAASSTTKAPASPKPKPAAAAAASSSALVLPDSAKDSVFELKDAEVSESTKALWAEFHSGCWSTACPVHATSHSPPASFFRLGSALVKALYGGMDFPPDFYHTLEFIAREQQKLMSPAASVPIDIGSYQPDAAGATADVTTVASAETAASSSSAAAAAPSSSSTCAWHAAGNSLLHSFSHLLGVQLVGPFKILCGHFRHVPIEKLHPFLLDRFFYDSPEVWSVLQRTPNTSGGGAREDIKDDRFSDHWAYYRDDPSADQPPVFVGRLSENSPAITLVGPNLLATLMALVDERQATLDEEGAAAKKQKTKPIDASQTKLTMDGSAAGAGAPVGELTLDTFRLDLDAFGRQHGYTLLAKGGKRPPPKRDSAWVKREKRVVVDLDNKVGLVVPYQADIGWRPVPSEPHELQKIVSDIERAKYAGAKVNFDALDYLVTLCNYATDERDPGMAIELALDLMAKSKTNAINSDICRLLALNYQQVDRPLYAHVIEEHMRHRARHIRQLPRDRFARVH